MLLDREKLLGLPTGNDYGLATEIGPPGDAVLEVRP
jgi:hypothetical protein